MWEIGFVLVVALIVLGPRQLTEAARVLARLYREVQKLTWDIRNSIDLDQLLPSPKNDTESKTSSESSQPPSHDPDAAITQDKDSGPDFYADLLEASKEENDSEQPKPESQEAAEPESSDKEQNPKEGETKDIERT